MTKPVSPALSQTEAMHRRRCESGSDSTTGGGSVEPRPPGEPRRGAGPARPGREARVPRRAADGRAWSGFPPWGDRGGKSNGPILRASEHGESGYNLVVLLVIVTVMNIGLALALPLWSTQAKREKEKELIFRGLQYAEAVRVFQARHGRLPTTLEELVEVEPRSIRQLYPRSHVGERQVGTPGAVGCPGEGPGQPTRRPWPAGPAGPAGCGRPAGAAAGTARSGSRRRVPAVSSSRERRRLPAGRGINPALGNVSVVKLPPGQGTEEGFGRRDRVTAGPIVGVYSATDEGSVILFNDRSNYQDWEFRADLIPTPAVLGGDSPVPRANSSLIGRPWPEGLLPQGVGTGNRNSGRNLTGGLGNDRSGNRQRNERRSGSRSGFGSNRR